MQTKSAEAPFWEKAVGVVGLLLVLSVLGILLYEALQPQTAPELVAQVQSTVRQQGGYLVQINASNHGQATAAGVLIEGSLYAAGDSAQPVETAQTTLDYVPDQSERSGGLLFEHDPSQYELRLQVKGFADP